MRTLEKITCMIRGGRWVGPAELNPGDVIEHFGYKRLISRVYIWREVDDHRGGSYKIYLRTHPFKDDGFTILLPSKHREIGRAHV